MAPVVLMVHGIASHTGNRHFKALKSKLDAAGVESHIVNYGFILLPITNQIAVGVVQRAAHKYQQEGRPVILVGYSNGAWTSVQVSETGYDVKDLVLISPALHARHAIPEEVESTHVYYSKGDVAVRFAKFRRIIRQILCFWQEPHGWGEMGRTGYQGKDGRVTNHQMDRKVGHQWFMFDEVVEEIADLVTNLVHKNETS